MTTKEIERDSERVAAIGVKEPVKNNYYKKCTHIPKARQPQRFDHVPRVNVEPFGYEVQQCRRGSMQQKFVEALAKGASLDELRVIAIRRDGTPWDDNAIFAMLYYDIRNKGYGVRTVHDFDRGLIYKLRFPDDAA